MRQQAVIHMQRYWNVIFYLFLHRGLWSSEELEVHGNSGDFYETVCSDPIVAMLKLLVYIFLYRLLIIFRF